MVEIMNKGLTVPKWVLIVQPKIPDLPNSPKSLGYCWEKSFIGLQLSVLAVKYFKLE